MGDQYILGKYWFLGSVIIILSQETDSLLHGGQDGTVKGVEAGQCPSVGFLLQGVTSSFLSFPPICGRPVFEVAYEKAAQQFEIWGRIFNLF